MGQGTDYMACGVLVGAIWLPFFNIGLGISVVKLGIVLMVLRIWDAVSDPIMGNLSDNTRSRWGRRRPYLFVGTILCVILFPLFFYMPTSLGESSKLTYLVILGVLYFTSYTAWSTGYYSLQLEMTPNYDERTRLAAWAAVFSKISVLFGGWVMAIATCSYFTDSTTSEVDLVTGMRTVCWLIVSVILVLGLLPAIFVKERYYKAEAVKQEKDLFLQSLKESVRCGPMWLLILISFLLVLGSYAGAALRTYTNIYYVFKGDISAASILMGYHGTIVMVLGISSIPLLTYLCERFDKKRMIVGLLVIATGGHLLEYFLMRPETPYLQLISAAAEACAITAFWMFLPSMKADVADYDEEHTSRRREGSLNAFFSWFIKVSLTLGIGVSTFALKLSGFSVDLKQQPPEVLSSMLHLYVFIPALLWAIATVVAGFYPLGRVRMDQIRQKLETRRGTV